MPLNVVVCDNAATISCMSRSSAACQSTIWRTRKCNWHHATRTDRFYKKQLCDWGTFRGKFVSALWHFFQKQSLSQPILGLRWSCCCCRRTEPKHFFSPQSEQSLEILEPFLRAHWSPNAAMSQESQLHRVQQSITSTYTGPASVMFNTKYHSPLRLFYALCCSRHLIQYLH